MSSVSEGYVSDIIEHNVLVEVYTRYHVHIFYVMTESDAMESPSVTGSFLSLTFICRIHLPPGTLVWESSNLSSLDIPAKWIRSSGLRYSAMFVKLFYLSSVLVYPSSASSPTLGRTCLQYPQQHSSICYQYYKLPPISVLHTALCLNLNRTHQQSEFVVFVDSLEMYGQGSLRMQLI